MNADNYDFPSSSIRESLSIHEAFSLANRKALEQASQFQDAMTSLQNMQHESPKREVINYKPGFQWVKFRVAYNGIAQHSTEVTAILNAYKVYDENKHKAKRVGA